MKTGPDISIPTCRAEALPVVDHFKKRMNPDEDYLLTISKPEGWTREGRFIIGKTHAEMYRVEERFSYTYLFELLKSKGGEHVAPNPDFVDFVLVAAKLDKLGAL